MKNFLAKFGLDINYRTLKNQPEWGYTIWMILAQLVVSVSAFALTYVLANYVSESVVGQYRFLFALYSSVSVCALWGMATALSQSVAAGKTGSYKVAVRIKTAYGLLGAVVFFAISGYYLVFDYQPVLALALFIIGLLLPASESYSLYASYLTGSSKFKLASVALTADKIVTTLMLIVVALVHPTLLSIVGTYFGTHLLMVYVLHRVTLNKIPPNDKVDKELVPYAKHITAMALVGALTSQLDKFILFIFFGPVSLANFWIASVVPQECGRLISIVTSTFFPRMVRDSTHMALHTVKKLFFSFFVVTMVGAGVYYFLAPVIFNLLLPAYAESIGMSAWLMLAYAVIPHVFVWNIFTANKMIKELYWYSIGEPVLVVGLYGLLIPLFGVWGLVYAVCLRTMVLNLVAVYMMYKYIK